MLLDNDTDGLYYRFVTDDTLSEEVYAHIKYAEDGLGFVVPTIEVHGAIYSLEEFMKA